MKSMSATKGIIVAGQYGTGKTETLIGLIRSASESNHSLRIGAFVAESANIALDAGRYGIGNNAAGVSFASVCCPTIIDMRQALDTALRDKSHDLLFLEPPGNLHPPLMAQVAVEKGIRLEHVIMLVSQRDFNDDRYTATFNSGLEIASIVGITHNIEGMPNTELMRAIKSANTHAPIISFEKGGLSYFEIENKTKWSLDILDGTSGFNHANSHGEHYQKALRVFDPELPCETILSILDQIAKTGSIARAKGHLPKYNLQIDMKRTSLKVTIPSQPLNQNGMGYAVFFAKGGLPLELIDQISIAPGQKPREMLENAPLESRFAVFGRLHRESQNNMANITANGEVTHTYSPVDEAERVANEIYKDSGDDSALRMILPAYHQTRLNALKELAKRPNTSQNAFAGMLISSVLINSSMVSEDGAPDYPKLADQHLMIKIKEAAMPALLHHSRFLRAEEISKFPRYEIAAGPYIHKAAQISWNGLDWMERGKYALARMRAKSNLVSVHADAGFNPLASLWGEW